MAFWDPKISSSECIHSGKKSEQRANIKWKTNQSNKFIRWFVAYSSKKIIQLKINERLSELQKEVSLKGFRPGKVPPSVIKSQFGKSIYGEVIDKILKESSSKAISEKKLKTIFSYSKHFKNVNLIFRRVFK